MRWRASPRSGGAPRGYSDFTENALVRRRDPKVRFARRSPRLPRFGEPGDEIVERHSRQLARLVARQGFDETKRPGKESGVDPLAQGSHDGFAGESRSDDESRQSRYRPVVFLGHHKSAVPYALD